MGHAEKILRIAEAIDNKWGVGTSDIFMELIERLAKSFATNWLYLDEKDVEKLERS